MKMDAHSGYGHQLPSAAWRLIWALNSLKDEDEHILIPGFYDDARSPSAEDRDLIEKIPNLEKSQQALLDQYGIESFLGGLSGVEAGLSVFNLIEQGFEDVIVTRTGAMWPYRADPSDPLVKLSSLTAKEVYGRETILIPSTGGSSPVYAFAKPLGNIPVISPGIGYWDSRTHAPDEHFRIEDFLNTSRNIARILSRFGEL